MTPQSHPSSPASIQRAINVLFEPGAATGERWPGRTRQVPGLLSHLAIGGAVRGMIATDDRLYVVHGTSLSSVSGGVATLIGTIPGAGLVSIEQNTVQVAVCANDDLYVHTISGTDLTLVGSFPGGRVIGFVDQRIVTAPIGQQTFYWSDLANASVFDALNFSSAEGAPDKLQSIVICNRDVWLLGSRTAEVWGTVGGETTFQRTSSHLEVGCVAPRSAVRLANGVYWLGRQGTVWTAQGYVPQRISNHGIEQTIQAVADQSEAFAYVHQWEGHECYCLSVPGLGTTLVYDVITGLWHERCDFALGEYVQSRVTCTAYLDGVTYAGGSDGILYAYSNTRHANGSQTMVRDIVSPHAPNPGGGRTRPTSMTVWCETGRGLPDGSPASIQMRHSIDGGTSWGPWRTASLGAIGERNTRARFHRIKSGFDHVFQFRITDDVQCDILGLSFD